MMTLRPKKLVDLGLRAIRTLYARKDLRRAPFDIWLKSAFSWVHHTAFSWVHHTSQFDTSNEHDDHGGRSKGTTGLAIGIARTLARCVRPRHLISLCSLAWRLAL